MSSTGSTWIDSCSSMRADHDHLVELVERPAGPRPVAASASRLRASAIRLRHGAAPPGVPTHCRRSVRTVPGAAASTADVLGQVPAAHALGAAAALHRSQTPGMTALPVSAATASAGCRLHLVHPRRGSDGEEAQFIAQCRSSARLFGQRVDIDLGFQRRADGARLAQLLQLAQHRLSQCDQRVPVELRARAAPGSHARWSGTPTSARPRAPAAPARSPRP